MLWMLLVAICVFLYIKNLENSCKISNAKYMEAVNTMKHYTINRKLMSDAINGYSAVNKKLTNELAIYKMITAKMCSLRLLNCHRCKGSCEMVCSSCGTYFLCESCSFEFSVCLGCGGTQLHRL
jgi:hypothetical protein